jgi:serine protease AprX
MVEFLYSIYSKGIKTAISLIFMMLSMHSQGQVSGYSYFYRVYFRDKGKNNVEDYLPTQLLSEKAIKRREKAGIEFPDLRDVPISGEYLNAVSSKGLMLHCTSRWMNTALFKSRYPVSSGTLLSLPFVSDVKPVKTSGGKSIVKGKLDFDLVEANEIPYDRPVTMLNGYSLHNQGYNGKGILIAVLDGGFDNAEEISSLTDLRNRKGILATFDFVLKNTNVYNASTHGTAVLSVLAGKLPDVIEGTAQDAEYLLMKTEDVGSEFPCEEDYWAAGAEYADSAGADIITTSLGYSEFDNPSLNYKYSDLDGNTAFITKVADIASSKGILVFSSAGNERNKLWRRIICPADGDSVIAVGAVDGNNLISDFSSAGPSVDRRIKPDNASMGVGVPVQTSVTTTGRANGTSFSCPVLSGMAACLMQAFPKARSTDIRAALEQSAHRYNSPDSLYGYGIPDMGIALLKLQDMFIRVPDEISVAGPNPTKGEFEIIFREPYESIIVEIFTTSGKLIWKTEREIFAGRSLRINELQTKEQGLYIVRVTTPGATMIHKIIKINSQ